MSRNEPLTPFCKKCGAVRRHVTRAATHASPAKSEFRCESQQCREERRKKAATRRGPRCPDCRHSAIKHDENGCRACYSAGPSGTFACRCAKKRSELIATTQPRN